MGSNKADVYFQNLIGNILDYGDAIETRNSKVKRYTNYMCTFHQAPLVSLRRTAWKNALREMEWFLSGSENIKDLHSSVHPWWKPWADEECNVINNYSKQFRRFQGADSGGYCVEEFDQINYLIGSLKEHPYSRRAIATTWHASDMTSPDTPITNCHGTTIQLFGNTNGTADMTMYQRSADVMLGLQHNWIQYWALLQYLCARSGRKVGSFTWIGGDCHIYEAHKEAAVELSEAILPSYEKELKLLYTPSDESFKADDFQLDGEYEPLETKKLELIV